MLENHVITPVQNYTGIIYLRLRMSPFRMDGHIIIITHRVWQLLTYNKIIFINKFPIHNNKEITLKDNSRYIYTKVFTSKELKHAEIFSY